MALKMPQRSHLLLQMVRLLYDDLWEMAPVCFGESTLCPQASLSDTLLAVGCEFIAGEMLFESPQKWLMVNDPGCLKSCIFAMLNVQGLRSDFWDVSCWSRIEAECCVQDMVRGRSDTVDVEILPVSSRKLQRLFLGFSPKATVCLMSQSHPALGSRNSCCQSSSWLWRCGSCQQSRWLWVMQVCSSPDRVGISEHHQALAADPCWLWPEPSFPHLFCASKSLILQVALEMRSWPEIVPGNGSGRKFPWDTLQGVWALLGGWWGGGTSIQGSCTCQRRDEWD